MRQVHSLAVSAASVHAARQIIPPTFLPPPRHPLDIDARRVHRRYSRQLPACVVRSVRTYQQQGGLGEEKGWGRRSLVYTLPEYH